MVDNMTAVTILNNMDTRHSWLFNELNKEIWTWCIHRRIWLTVAHIPGKTNVVAENLDNIAEKLSGRLIQSYMKRVSVSWK